MRSNKAFRQDSQLRRQIAQTSAKLMVEEGIDDFMIAKQKAMNQLGIGSTMKNLPSNSEIQEEILIYQRLFCAETHTKQLQHLRQIALNAMQLLKMFNPRLVGSVLIGTVHNHSEIVLHLFADTPENVAFFLMEQGIPYETLEKRFRPTARESHKVLIYPSYRFLAGDEAIVLVIFAVDDIRWAPRSPVDGKPMQRADLHMVAALLED